MAWREMNEEAYEWDINHAIESKSPPAVIASHYVQLAAYYTQNARFLVFEDNIVPKIDFTDPAYGGLRKLPIEENPNHGPSMPDSLDHIPSLYWRAYECFSEDGAPKGKQDGLHPDSKWGIINNVVANPPHIPELKFGSFGGDFNKGIIRNEVFKSLEDHITNGKKLIEEALPEGHMRNEALKKLEFHGNGMKELWIQQARKRVDIDYKELSTLLEGKNELSPRAAELLQKAQTAAGEALNQFDRALETLSRGRE